MPPPYARLRRHLQTLRQHQRLHRGRPWRALRSRFQAMPALSAPQRLHCWFTQHRPVSRWLLHRLHFCPAMRQRVWGWPRLHSLRGQVHKSGAVPPRPCRPAVTRAGSRSNQGSSSTGLLRHCDLCGAVPVRWIRGPVWCSCSHALARGERPSLPSPFGRFLSQRRKG